MPAYPEPAVLGGSAHLHPLDLTLIVLYLIGITLFGLRFREKKVKGAAPAAKSLQSYFLADNTIPWWAIALSIVSAETSTLTIISIPGVAYAGDFGFLQVVLGYMIGRIVVAALFLPRYFEGRMLTAYQLIDQRFGSTLHKTTAGLFLLTRAAAEGVRVFAVSIVVSIAIGTGDLLSIALITALTLLYTFEGGLAAVIWTDVVQMVIYVAGTVIALITLGSHVPGGWSAIQQVAGAAGKFHMLNFTLNLTTTYTFWAGILGGTFLTMASHGTDQLMVQRMLAARSLKESRLALLSSGVVIFIQFAFFLLIGAGLYAFYSFRPTPFAGGPAGLMPPDRLFPSFIVHEMPTGIAGLLVAAILAAAMSNLSAALNSLSSTTVVDFYLPWRARSSSPSQNLSSLAAGGGPASRSTTNANETASQQRNRVAKLSTVIWAIILFAVAAYSLKAGGHGHVVETGLSIASVAYGALLGVFLLGTLTRYATQTGALLGMIAGFIFNLALWLQPSPIIPKVAFTWYVFLGSLVTFAVGSLASLLFRKQSLTRHRPTIIAAAALAFLVVVPGLQAQTRPKTKPGTPPLAPSAKGGVANPQTYDFTSITTLLNEAIAAKKLPGAVVLIGHDNKIVFEQAFGVRKLAGEPNPEGKASPAEPMTEDTVFDMASLTKCLVTATAIMQLYEAGKLQFDDPIQKYLPAFNPLVNGKTDPERAKVTIRTLLTHYSGEPEDVSLKDPWGLAAPDEAEGIRRALTAPLKSVPAQTFLYSDINFILLGHLVETLTGEPLNGYAYDHIFHPLAMNNTRYHAFSTPCGPMTKLGANILFANFNEQDRKKMASGEFECDGSWLPITAIPETAPTAHDNEGTATTNPDFDRLLRATVHDPTTRRMGGVAGHAGLFSTAGDISIYAQALLDKLTRNTGPFPLKQSTLKLMTRPEQPSTALPGATVFTPDGQPTQGISLRGFGWDSNTAFSRPRGTIFPLTSFGHTGFTGTSLWMDPTSNTYVILLANAIHPRGGSPISPLRGTVATAAAQALHLSRPTGTPTAYIPPPPPKDLAVLNEANTRTPSPIAEAPPARNLPLNPAAPRPFEGQLEPASPPANSLRKDRTLTGIDVLEQTHYAALREAASRHANRLNLGLLTNQSGVDAQGHRTIDLLATEAPRIDKTIHLQTLFSPEHGITGKQDSTSISQDETDTTTQLPIIGLYGVGDAKRRPSHAQLADLDAVVIDLQNAGVRFWTYDTVTAYFLEASAREQRDYHHDLEIIVLDRPNPIGGLQVQGPLSDPGRESYIDYMPLPVRHGFTLGELARYINGEASLTDGPHALYTPGTDPTTASSQQNATTSSHKKKLSSFAAGGEPASPTPTIAKGLNAHLTVVPMQNWTRFEYFDETGLPWTNPSPNLRSVIANTLYPGIGLFDTSNLSVGRGTDAPFEHLGAGTAPGKPAWFDGKAVAACLNARAIPGVTIAPTIFAVAEDVNHYPYHGQMIQGIHLSPTDRNTLDSPELAVEIMTCLHHLYPTQFPLARLSPILASASTLAALEKGTDPHAIYASWQSSLAEFRMRSRPYLLYH